MRPYEGPSQALLWVRVVTKLLLHSSAPHLLTAYSITGIKMRLLRFESELPTYLTLGSHLISKNRTLMELCEDKIRHRVKALVSGLATYVVSSSLVQVCDPQEVTDQ